MPDVKGRWTYACLIENWGAQGETLTPGVPDRWFVRGRVPMTKEEIRWLSLCRLGLNVRAYFMISEAEPARLRWRRRCGQNSCGCTPWNREEACGLIAENASRAGVKNLVVVKGRRRNVLGNSRRRRTRSSAEAAADCGDPSGTPGENRMCVLS